MQKALDNVVDDLIEEIVMKFFDAVLLLIEMFSKKNSFVFSEEFFFAFI